MRRAAGIVVAALLTVTLVVGSSAAQDEDPRPPRNGPVHPGVSAAEMAAVRALALKDLRNELSRNGEQPKPDGMREEFKRCSFRRLMLGKLGTAVMMSSPGLEPGVNSGMYYVYVRRNGVYRRIAEGSGFGPYIVNRNRDVPDLVFGGTGGVCHARFTRLRFQGSRYRPDACVEEVYVGDDCQVQACSDGRNLPIFPEPPESSSFF